MSGCRGNAVDVDAKIRHQQTNPVTAPVLLRPNLCLQGLKAARAGLRDVHFMGRR